MFGDRISSLNLKLPEEARLISLSLSPQRWDYKNMLSCLAFYRGS